MIKKLSLFVFMALLTSKSFAQNWGGGVDDETLHFGFNFQYVSSEYKILKKTNWREQYKDIDSLYITDPLTAIYGQPSPGFGVGFVVNYNLGENADVRLTPSLIFNDRLVNYQYQSPTTVGMSSSLIQKSVQATMVEFPLGIKLKSDRRNNFRAYMLAGGKYSMDIASSKKTNDAGKIPLEKLLKNRKNYFSYEAAIGFDLYFEYFKMSPELKLSYSTKSVLKPEDHPFARPLDKLMLRQFTFSLFFE